MNDHHMEECQAGGHLIMIRTVIVLLRSLKTLLKWLSRLNLRRFWAPELLIRSDE